MAIRLYKESSLATSEIFKGINEQTKAQEKAINLIKNSKHLSKEDIISAYISVQQITDTLTRAALKAFNDGKTILIYNDVPSLSVVQALPFITLKTPKGYITYVFMDKYIRVSRDNVLLVEPSILRDLLTGALISTALKVNYDMLASNQYLQRTCMDCYTKFMTRVINKDFSVAADKVLFDEIQYHINKFFLTKVYCASDTPENIEALASAHFKFVDELKIEEIKNLYTQTDPQQISDLLRLLQVCSPRLKGLRMDKFMSSWINYYYIPATFAIDNIEYLLFMMLTLLAGNNIINVGASNIVKECKNIKSFRAELLKLIQS